MEQNRGYGNKPTNLHWINMQQKRQEYTMEKRQPLQQVVLGKLMATLKQWNKNTLIPYTKINSKCFTDLNVRHDIIKLLEGNIRKTFFDINCSNIFLDQFPKTKEIKAKINKWDLIKLKCFCTAKEIIYNMKRYPINLRKLSTTWKDRLWKGRKHLQIVQLTRC